MLRIMQENVEDLMSPNLWLALVAEFTGTLVITLFGCGALISGVSVVQTALTFGLAVASVIWVFGHVSGGHFNPAVTTASLLTRRVSIIRGVLYVLVQMAGAISGAGLLHRLTPSGSQQNLGANVLAADVTSAQGFGFECLITFIYVLVVSASNDEKRSDLKGSAALSIGLAVVAGQLFAVPYTLAGMNPARSLGPALITNTWTNHWVFWVGPEVGGVLAGLLYEYVLAAGATFTGVRKCLLRTRKPKKQAGTGKAPPEEVVEIGEANNKVDGGNAGVGKDLEKGEGSEK